MGKTSIEWTDETLNPIRARHTETGKLGWHCTKPSAGCKNCYAEAMNKWRGTGLPFVPASREKLEIFLDEKVLQKPLHWKKPRKIFMCDMTDLFHEDIPDEFIEKVVTVMSLTPQHTYQVLTKRPERMRAFFSQEESGLLDRLNSHAGTFMDWDDMPDVDEFGGWPMEHLWLLVSVENQPTADERIPILLQTPAAVRGISLEPMLEPVDLSRFITLPICAVHHSRSCCGRKPPLDWVVVGGESGPGARPCDVAWIRSIVQQCRAAGVKCFVKQLGARPVHSLPKNAAGWTTFPALNFKDKKGGAMEEWPEDLRVREFPR